MPDDADQLARLKAALTGRYRVERELGHGGMATVYLAHDLKDNRLVALKVLRPELAAAVGPERFLREIAIVAQLTHPNILPLHDSGESAGVLYYVMPYYCGGSSNHSATPLCPEHAPWRVRAREGLPSLHRAVANHSATPR